jgi:polyisoprenyl-phosphate glycosyltransferase
LLELSRASDWLSTAKLLALRFVYPVWPRRELEELRSWHAAPGTMHMRTSPLVSLVVPFFNEGDAVDVFHASIRRVLAVLPRINFEIICVDDGSRDDTLAKLVALAENDPRYRIIELSRNFGKEAALTAGIDDARGDAVILLDDCRLLNRAAVEALKKLPERQRFMKGLLAWVGFKSVTVDYTRQPRAAGKTKFSGWKLWNLALEGITSFSTLPLKIWTYIGCIGAFLTFCYGTFIVVRTLIHGTDVPGYASLLVSVIFFGSLQLISIGLLGEYIGRIYLETKQRPSYLVRSCYGKRAKSNVYVDTNHAKHVSGTQVGARLSVRSLQQR